MSFSVPILLIATFMSGALVFFTRLFPFALFSKKEPPKIIRVIEKYIPPMVMAILLVYCFKDVQYSKAPYGAPNFIALLVTVVLHLWKNNSMISIFGGTILFMILQRVF